MFLSTSYIPHGHCYLWQIPLVWLHITADLLIAIAYYSIPITLFYFVRKQQDNPFEKIIVLFSWFILSCGTTHIMSVWTLWHPDYWVSGTIKAATALISCYTAVALVKYVPYALDLPNPAVLAKVNRDLAEEIELKKTAQLELQKERLFLKTLLNSLSVGIVACDEQGILALFNQASRSIFGKSQPLPPQTWAKHYNLFYPDGKTYLEEQDLPLSKAFAGETFTDFEIVTVKPDGQVRSLVTNGSPIVDSDGNKFGAVVAVIDVSESKRAEARLNRLNKELLQSNQELEQFAYVASHDLREPLRMVISFTQLLAQRYQNNLDSEADTIIGFAVDGAKRMEILIEDLLSYSRLGKQNRAFKAVDCNLVVEKALSNLQMSIKESQAKIDVKPLPQVVGDEIQLVQLFQNLIGNAITYRSNSQPYLEIVISATPLEIGWSFSVKDNGIGIEPENYRRIFEVFQRLHPKEKFSGTGIGLAICKKIVERHDGKIWVESEYGSGSTFRFSLNCQTIDNI